MKLAKILLFSFGIFSLHLRAEEKSQRRLDFSSYVRENFQVLTSGKKKERYQMAFQEEQPKTILIDPTFETKIGFDNKPDDKGGKAPASTAAPAVKAPADEGATEAAPIKPGSGSENGGLPQ